MPSDLCVVKPRLIRVCCRRSGEDNRKLEGRQLAEVMEGKVAVVIIAPQFGS